MHVLRHARGIAADVEMRAVFQPRVQFARLFAQAVLHVDLAGLIAREREVEAMQRAALECVLPLDLVEEILAGVRVAEEQPVATGGGDGFALLHEGAERRDAGARADHDDVLRAVGGQAEALVVLDVDLHLRAFLAGGEEMRGRAPAGRVASGVLDMGNGEVRFVADGLAARCDRIQARLQRTQGLDQRFGGPCARMVVQQVDDLRIGHQRGQCLALVGREQAVQRVAAGVRGVGGDEGAAQAGDLAALAQPVAQGQGVRAHGDRCGGIEAEFGDDRLDQGRRILDDHAERVARFVVQAGAFQRQFDVADIFFRAAAGDALVGEQLGDERALAGPGDRCGECGRSGVTVASGALRAFSASLPSARTCATQGVATVSMSRSASARATQRCAPRTSRRASMRWPMAQNCG